MELTRRNPFRDLESMERQMRRMFPGFAFVAPAPPADVYETDDEVVVELELPGFTEKELDVELLDHTLSVRGERKEETEREEKAFHLRERLTAAFERRFELPAEVDRDHVEATFDKGILAVHVPKTAPTKPTRVEIEAKG